MNAIKTEYARSNDGLTHLISALNGEYTVCGNAFDGDANGELPGRDPFAWDDCPEAPVDCPKCAKEIINCKGAKTK